MDDIHRAARRLEGVAVRTPVLSVPAVDEIAGATVYLKAESLQLTGAFKFRGAYNAVASLDTASLAAGVVTYSSGNHAQALARAASMCGTTAVIVMPTDAPLEKIKGTEANGGRIVFYDRFTEDRAEIAGGIGTEEGRVLIPPFDHPDVIAGQGTTALELLDQVGPLDALVVCVGGGGLLAGCATAATTLLPAIKMFGVEPELGNDHVLSMAAGHRVTIGVPATIADGQQNSAPGELTWPITSRLASSFSTVTDQEIVTTMKLLFSAAKLVVEPSGATALAAVLHDLAPELAGQRVGVTLSGGNIGIERLTKLFAP